MGGRCNDCVSVQQVMTGDRGRIYLARVGLAADAVHCDGDGLVRLPADGPERHAVGAEPRHDSGSRLNLVRITRTVRDKEEVRRE